jgi:hypothetical protein
MKQHPAGSITLRALKLSLNRSSAEATASVTGALMNAGSAKATDAIGRWFKWISTQPDGDFRTDESVHEQHFRASLPADDWRVAYGMDSPQARALVSEIQWHRKHGLSLDGLAWPSSDDLYAPANDPITPITCRRNRSDEP